MSTHGTLSIVATPIGNLEDITHRALTTLKEADLILAEDTRVTRKLLDRYNITQKPLSYHQHTGEKVTTKIIDKLASGKHIALVTDAGTPGVSDPGNRLIELVVHSLGEAVRIEPIPGPSALTTMLSVAGIPIDRFIFYGFIPHKKGRQKLFTEIAQNHLTSAMYESPHRIIKTLEALNEVLDEHRTIVVGRELTKKFETIYRGNINQVLEKVRITPKGEFVILIQGK
jgi:16S rRNA (cytidine1402-2'-O)-methyltransferase